MFAKDSNRTMLVCVGLVIITALLYWPALRFGFVVYDDPDYVVNNWHLNQGFSLAGWKWAFQAGYAANWHPLTWLSHMLDCQLFGLKPAGHHAVSVLIHALNSVLVFLVFRRLTGAFWRSAMVAALFAWHPLHVESVAWISERKDVLCAFFFLLSLWFYAGYARGFKVQSSKFKVVPGSPIFSYGLALLCFALSLMAKPMAVTLPCVLLLLDYWPLRRGRVEGESGPQGDSSLPLSRLLLEKAPFFSLTMGCSVLTMVAQSGAIVPLGHWPISTRLMNGIMAYFSYLKKTIWPADLAVIYPRVNWTLGVGIVAVAAGLAALTCVVIGQRKTRPYWLVGWLWFLGMLVPVIGVITVGGTAMADRFMYLPSLGIFLIFCWEAGDRFSASRYRERILGGLAGVVLSVSLVASSIQLSYWQDNVPLFTHTLAVTRNNYMARLLLGEALVMQGKMQEASPHLVEVIRLMPQFPDAHYQYAVALAGLGRTKEAMQEYRRTLALEPGFPLPLNNLAWTLAADPRPEYRNGPEAVELATRACDATRYGEAIMIGTLAAAYAEAGRFTEAVATAQKAQAVALAHGEKELAARNLELQKLYQAGKPYHEPSF